MWCTVYSVHLRCSCGSSGAQIMYFPCLFFILSILAIILFCLFILAFKIKKKTFLHKLNYFTCISWSYKCPLLLYKNFSNVKILIAHFSIFDFSREAINTFHHSLAINTFRHSLAINTFHHSLAINTSRHSLAINTSRHSFKPQD